MANSEQMPRVDMAKEFAKLSESDQHFVKKLEQLNKTRAKDVKVLRGKNKIFGAVVACTVFGIYAYTMTSIKQENFLDFEETPESSKN